MFSLLEEFLCSEILINSHYMDSCLQVVLNNATVETDNPDLRDRAYIYWRLLSTDPEVRLFPFLSLYSNQ